MGWQQQGNTKRSYEIMLEKGLGLENPSRRKKRKQELKSTWLWEGTRAVDSQHTAQQR